MTAIAWKDGVLAADSRELLSDGTIQSEHCTKLFSHKHYVLGVCGDSDACAWFNAWLCNDFKYPFTVGNPDACALLVDKELKKLYLCYPNGAKEELDIDIPFGIGSGGVMARAFMTEFKCSPQRAIKLTSKYDTSVNDRVKKRKCW